MATFFRTLYYFFAMSALFMAFVRFGWIILVSQDFGISLALTVLFSSISSTVVYLFTIVQQEIRSSRITRMIATIASLFLASLVPVIVLLLLSTFNTTFISLAQPHTEFASKIWGAIFATVWLGWLIVGLLIDYFSPSEGTGLTAVDAKKSSPKSSASLAAPSRTVRATQQEVPEYILLWALARKRVAEGQFLSANGYLLESLSLLEQELSSDAIERLHDVFELTYQLALNQMKLAQHDLAKFSLERALSLRQRLPDATVSVSFAELMRKLEECRMRSRGENQI